MRQQALYPIHAMSRHDRHNETFGAAADAEIDAFVRRAAASDLSRLPALSAFQRQMEAYPQLSAAAQLEMVDKVRSGEEAAERLPRARSDASRKRLQRQIREGRRAADYLVGSTFRLVLLICSERAKARYGAELAGERMPDIVSEANLALAEAISNFDVAKCPTFSAYAARVVRDHVQQVCSNDGPVKVAASWARARRIATMRLQALTEEFGRPPTNDELQEDLLEHCMRWAFERLTEKERALPEKQRREVQLAKLRKQGMLGAIANVEQVLAAGQSLASLDAPVGFDGSGTLGDLIEDPDSDIGAQVEFDELSATLREALAELKPREQEIIRMRFGLGMPDERTFTYAQIGSRFKVSAERIRQIERSVLDRLASNPAFRSALTGHISPE